MPELWNYDPEVVQPDQPIVDFDVVTHDTVIGTVASAVRDDDIAFLVVKTGGLISNKQVVIPAGLVKQISVGAERVFLRVDREAIADAPDFEEDWRSDQSWRERATARFPQ